MNYQNPAGTKFPIIAQAPMPQNLINLFSGTDESASTIASRYKTAFNQIAQSLSQCGFNVALFGSSFEIMDAMLDACSANGVNVILNPVWLNDSPLHTKAVIDHYKSRPNGRPVAWQVFDQPKFYDWGDAVGMDAPEDIVWNNLTVGLWNARGLDGTRMVYFNLAAPEYNDGVHDPDEWIGSSANYNQYLDALQKLYNPVLWSYDLYPFNIKGNSTDIEVRYDHFYRYLKVFGDRACDTGVPFWAYCMCLGHSYWKVDSAGNRTKVWTQPVPTEGMLRFEAFNALAFGAQGLVYWQYGQPSDGPASESGLTFAPAPFDFSVKSIGTVKTLTPVSNPVWRAVQKVNSEIQKYAHVFLGAEIKDIFHLRKTYDGQEMFPGSYGHIAKVQCFEEGVLISAFEKDKKNYFVIVNQDPFGVQEVIISISSNTKGTFLTDDDPETFYIPKPANPNFDFASIFTRTLPEGGVIILEWTEGDFTGEIVPPVINP